MSVSKNKIKHRASSVASAGARVKAGERARVRAEARARVRSGTSVNKEQVHGQE